MLPGFRFLVGAIILSMSILVFGLGAAALLRTAHEEFAANPYWRAAPEPIFAQPGEATPPVLATLRVDPPAREPDLPDKIAAPGSSEPAFAVPASVPTDLKQIEAETASTLKRDDLALSEPATLPMTALAGLSTTPRDGTLAIDQSDIPVSAISPAAVDQGGIVKVEPSLPASIASGPASEPVVDLSRQASAPLPGENAAALPARSPSTRAANLDASSASVSTPSPSSAVNGSLTAAKADPSIAKKRQDARRAAQRRRVALRARMARQAQQQQVQQQQPANPFAGQFAQPPTAGTIR